MHTLSAKGPTQNYYQSVCIVRAGFAGSDKNCSKHLLRVYFMDDLAMPCDYSVGKGCKDQQVGFTFLFISLLLKVLHELELVFK